MKNIFVWFAGILADEIKKRLLEADVKVSLLNLEPGDRIILRAQTRLPDSAYKRIQQQIEELFPGHRAVILDEGLELFVGRDEDNKLVVKYD